MAAFSVQNTKANTQCCMLFNHDFIASDREHDEI